MRRTLRQRLRATRRPGKAPAAVGGFGARQRHDAGKDGPIDQVNEAAQPVDGRRVVQVCERKSAGAFVDLAQVRRARRRPDLATAAPPGARRRAAPDRGWSPVPAAGHFVCRPAVTASASTPAEPMARTPSAREISGPRSPAWQSEPQGRRSSRGRRPLRPPPSGESTRRSAHRPIGRRRPRTASASDRDASRRAATSFRPSSIRHVDQRPACDHVAQECVAANRAGSPPG